jgi:ATP-dependent Clp protease ATP-binding subunit ClpA
VADVEAIVAKMAQIPPKQVSTNDKSQLKHLEDGPQATSCSARNEAVEDSPRDQAVARRPAHPEKPIGSFLFTGPTGVGKTELAKQLAKSLGSSSCAST